jgi:uncharacterized membrane protein YphA (DoxX/SURF4 family)
LGLVFVGAGVAAFVSGFATPPDLPENLKVFNAGMAATVYFMPLLKAVEIVCGVMLLSGLFVPLALVILAPIVIHIALVHAFMAPQGLPLAIVLLALEGYLALLATPYRDRILPLFRR